MKRYIIIALVALFVCILGLSAITNPSQEDYVSYVKDQIKHESNHGLIMTSLASFFGGMYVEQKTIKHNYIFFSVYKTKLDDKQTLKTIGVFDHFITLDSGTQ